MAKKDNIDNKSNDKDTNEARRDALKKLGTYAFAAPVMLSLVASKKASALSPPPAPNG
ncbi:MAG: hypothetical protein KAH20_14605 [Methylococcales bacterium]|nr:hypothetical protein [Methylococcales bacterium]